MSEKEIRLLGHRGAWWNVPKSGPDLLKAFYILKFRPRPECLNRN